MDKRGRRREYTSAYLRRTYRDGARRAISNLTWYQVAIKAVRGHRSPLDPPLGGIPELAGMELLRKGSRLSVQPVTPSEWDAIMAIRAESR